MTETDQEFEEILTKCKKTLEENKDKRHPDDLKEFNKIIDDLNKNRPRNALVAIKGMLLTIMQAMRESCGKDA